MKRGRTRTSATHETRAHTSRFKQSDIGEKLLCQSIEMFARHGLTFAQGLPFLLRWAVDQDSITPDGEPDFPPDPRWPVWRG